MRDSEPRCFPRGLLLPVLSKDWAEAAVSPGTPCSDHILVSDSRQT